MTVQIVVDAPVVEVNPSNNPVDVIVNAPSVEINPITQVVEINPVTNPVEIVVDDKPVTVITAGIQGERGIRGPVGPSGSGSFTMICGEIIGANAPIKTGGDNLAYIGSNLVGDDAGKIVGISQNSALIGEEIQVSRGELHNATWNFAPGLIFLGDRQITAVPPLVGFTQILATVLSPTDIMGTLFTPTGAAI